MYLEKPKHQMICNEVSIKGNVSRKARISYNWEPREYMERAQKQNDVHSYSPFNAQTTSISKCIAKYMYTYKSQNVL
jgi:hypothetical protein